MGSSFYSPLSQDNWLGGAGDWSNSSKWSSGLPGAGSDVFINTGNDNVTWDTSTNINSLTLGGSTGNSSLSDEVGNWYVMNIAGSLTVNQTGSIDLQSQSGAGDTIIANANSSNAGSINIGLFSLVQVNANLTNSGSIGLDGFYGIGYGSLGVAGNLINTGTITDNFTLSGNVTVGGDLQNSRLVSVANLQVGHALTNSAIGLMEIENSGSSASLSNAGNLSLDNSFGVAGDATNSGTMQLLYGGEGAGGGLVTIGGTLTNTATGVITLSGYPGETLSANNLSNAGSVQLLGFGNLQANNITDSGTIATLNPAANTITVSGRFTNNAGGTLQLGGTGGDIARMGSMINLGSVVIGNGSSLTVPVGGSASGSALSGYVNSGNTLIQQGGTLTSYAKYTQNNGQTTVGGHLAGVINFAGGSVYGNGGTISGSVTSNAAINFGDTPMTVGQLTFAGNFAQGVRGSLTFDIAGLNSYDQMNITGQARLNGTMYVDLIHGYVPQVGNVFEIMTFAGETGTFANVVGLPINGQEHFTLEYNSTNLTLDVVAGPLQGLNASQNHGSNEPYLELAEAGGPSQGQLSGMGGQTTPEPGSFLLLGTAVSAAAGWLRRTRIR